MNFKKYIVFEAVPFCFGPVATSMEVLKILKGRISYDIFWLASGTTLSLLKEDKGSIDIIECDTTKYSEVIKYKDFLSSAEIVVSNTNPDFSKWCLGFGCKVAYIDILYWMWDKVPDFFENLDPFIIEKFVGLEEQYARLGKPKNAHEVGPLISNYFTNETTKKENMLFVSFGGVVNPFNNYTKHIDLIIEIILNISSVKSFDKLLICGGGLDNSIFFEKYKNSSKIIIKTLSRSEYMHNLKKSKKVIISPGLTGFYETYYNKITPYFLIPHNYSQYLQLLKFKEMGLAKFSFNFEDAGIKTNIGCYENEENAVKKIEKCLDSFCLEKDAHERLRNSIEEYLESNSPFQSNTILSQDSYKSGCEKAANIIIEKILK